MTPIFVTNFSFKSVLTLDVPEKVKEGGPDSIIQIVKDAGLKEVYIADYNLDGFVTAYENCSKNGIQLKFGLKIPVTDNPEDALSYHKIILWIKNIEAYKVLCKVYSKIHIRDKENVYLTNTELDELYKTNLFFITLPFYSSYIAKNLLSLGTCLFDHEKYNAKFHLERNDHPYDKVLADKLKELDLPTFETKTILYKNRKNFVDYATYMCIQKRSVLNKPQIDHLGSIEFCWESYLENK